MSTEAEIEAFTALAGSAGGLAIISVLGARVLGTLGIVALKIQGDTAVKLADRGVLVETGLTVSDKGFEAGTKTVQIIGDQEVSTVPPDRREPVGLDVDVAADLAETPGSSSSVTLPLILAGAGLGVFLLLRASR